MNAPTLRDSRDDDLVAIQAIYAHHVRHGTGSFELEPPTVDEMRGRRADVLKNGFPWLVAEAEGRVMGYAYANFFRMRPAYRFTVENSIYIAHQLGMHAGRSMSKLRKQTVKPVFGIIKRVMGWRQMNMRGLDKANVEWNVVTMARNIKRMHVLRAA